MNKQAGFSIVMAIFILVVLSLLGSYMVKLSGVQHATSVFAVQGARAYQSARAGIGWAVARVHNGGGCGDVTAASPLSFADINGFSVSLTCTSQSFSEGVDTIIVYKMSALSEFGSYNSASYISRKIEVSIVN